MNKPQDPEAAETTQTTSVPAVDLPRLVQPAYKSDLTEGRKPPADAVHLKTRCTKCQKPMDCHWSPDQTWGGVPCTAEEYMAKALQSENVGIYCDDCMEKMPDVKLEDLRHE